MTNLGSQMDLFDDSLSNFDETEPQLSQVEIPATLSQEDLFNDFLSTFDETELSQVEIPAESEIPDETELSQVKIPAVSRYPTSMDVLKSTIQLSNREKNLQASNKNLALELDKSMTKISELELDVSAFKKQVELKTKQLEEANLQNFDLRKQLQEKDSKIQDLQKQLKLDTSAFKKQVEFKTKQLEEADLQNFDLRKQLQEKDELNLQQSEQLEEADLQNFDLTEQLQKKDSKIQDLQAQLSHLDPPQIKQKTPKLDVILNEAKKLLHQLSKEIFDVEEIKAMDKWNLKQKHDSNCYKDYKEMQSKIYQVELKLEEFEINNEYTLYDLERNKIKNQLAMCLDVKEKLQHTSDNLKNEVKERYISSERHEQVDISNIKWIFDGTNNPIHVYTFFKYLENFFKEHGITPEWGGKYLKDLTRGIALKWIEDTFPLMGNPPLKETKDLLKKHFGTKSKIMQDIFQQHTNIGKVPEDTESSVFKSKKYAILHEHCTLIESASLVRVPQNDPDEDEQMCDYTEILFTNLNFTQRLSFQRQVENMNKEEKFQTIIKLYNLEKEIAASHESNPTKQISNCFISNTVNEDYCVNENASEVSTAETTCEDGSTDITSEVGTYEAPSETDSLESEARFLNVYKHDISHLKHPFLTSRKEVKGQRDYVITDIKDNSCPLCRLMLFQEKHKPKCSRHVTPHHNTGIVFVESCNFIRELPITSRLDYLNFLEFCHVCLQHPTRICWKDGKCIYASKQPQTLMCEKCPNRIVTCKDHYESNLERLQKFKQTYAALGMDINIELEYTKN